MMVWRHTKGLEFIILTAFKVLTNVPNDPDPETGHSQSVLKQFGMKSSAECYGWIIHTEFKFLTFQKISANSISFQKNEVVWNFCSIISGKDTPLGHNDMLM